MEDDGAFGPVKLALCQAHFPKVSPISSRFSSVPFPAEPRAFALSSSAGPPLLQRLTGARPLSAPTRTLPSGSPHRESPRPRDGHMIRRALVQSDPEKLPQRERIRPAPGDPVFAVDGFEKADHHQPEICPGGSEGRPS